MNNKIIYENKVKDLGALATAFAEEDMIILFGDNAPDTLADYCYSIDINPVKETIKVGQIFMFDGVAFNITAVGEIAEKNLANLGHITISFNGSTGPILPGTICVEKKEMPKIKIGSEISILA